MNKREKEILIEIRDKINYLLCKEELQLIGTLYNEKGKYDLYLFPESSEGLNWYQALICCKALGGSLPTIGELQFMYDNGLGKSLGYKDYWSSTECNDMYVDRYSFYIGNTYTTNKNSVCCVRAVRRCYYV